ncbi:MAG: acyl-ACP desaturase [Candidatus Latescibacteria bacterium]|nr:acyl-ACP desaturase [Candidatus Latescibacterota bacterium]
MMETGLHPHRLEVMATMEDFVAGQLSILKTVENSWQPNDFLPDMTSPDWPDRIVEFRRQAETLADEILVVLVGDMITEEALPTYQTLLNTFEGAADPTGASDSPWAQWSRGWTAEENRHGDLLNKYLYLTGRVDMQAIEVTIQHLIRNGFNPSIQQDPYRGFIYTSFQERATRISHRNVSRLALKAGDDNLKTICGLVAGDEARHEKAYTSFVRKILELDPDGAVLAFKDMMQHQIVMPAHLMYDGEDVDVFDHFSLIAEKIGVYTATDYTEIMEHLLRQWKLEDLTGLSPEAAEAQDYLCGLPARYRKLNERRQQRQQSAQPIPFSWIHGRTV